MRPSQVLLFAFFSFLLHTPVRAQQMFRGNVHHTGYARSEKNVVFDYQKWKFDAGAPIRSTPLSAQQSIYFGTSGGHFLCLDAGSGKEKWRFDAGSAVNSSPAYQNSKVFFSDNRQRLFALNANNGQELWQYSFAAKLAYPWRFDYYYSSPLLYKDKLYIGGDDGYLYCITQDRGKLVWKFKTTGLVRSTPALYQNSIIVGDTEGLLFSIDAISGKELWRFATYGHTLRNEEFGYDRRAIIASPAIQGNRVFVGSRDGFLYCVDAIKGTLNWKLDHNISWVNTSVAVNDTILVTGTSDGRFVQGVHANTGKELWKTKTTSLVWSSPMIYNQHAYAATFEGQLLCLDLRTGKRVTQYYTTDKILSSPVIDNETLYVGADNGYLLALQSRPTPAKQDVQPYVFYEPDARIYFKNSADGKIKNFLEAFGFTPLDSKGLHGALTTPSDKKKVIVFATNYFPKEVRANGHNSLLVDFLNSGNRVILLGNNPAFYDIDEGTRNISANFLRADTILNVNYSFNDTRGHGGIFPSAPTLKGKQWGLPEHWVSSFSLEPAAVDIVLGKNENGLASAWVKRFRNGGELIQIWMHPETPTNLDCLLKLSEEEINE